MQNPHFGSKIKIPKNMSNSILQILFSCAVKKTAPKNTKYWRNELAIMQRPCKILTYGHKLEFKKKHVKIHSTNHLQLFCAKNRSKKN